MKNFRNVDENYDFFTEAINFLNRYYTSTEEGPDTVELEKGFAEHYWYEIDALVRNIEKASASKINAIVGKLNNGKLPCNSITQHYENTYRLVRSYDPSCTYSPHIQLFYDLTSRTLDDFPTSIEAFQELVKKIRAETQTSRFRKSAGRRKEKLKSNESAAFDYTDLIFENHARLLVLRVDLYLRTEGLTRMEQHDRIRNYFSQFLNNRRSNKFFDHELGYIWKFENGVTRGGHYHLILMLNGAYAQKDEHIASEIGRFWMKITNGEGSFFNVNSKKHLDNLASQGQGVGVGRIESYDAEKRENLYRVIKYFFKMEQYVDVKSTPGSRSFGKGIFKKKTAAGGRPRKLRIS
jgi:hypothetical protein